MPAAPVKQPKDASNGEKVKVYLMTDTETKYYPDNYKDLPRAERERLSSELSRALAETGATVLTSDDECEIAAVASYAGCGIEQVLSPLVSTLARFYVHERCGPACNVCDGRRWLFFRFDAVAGIPGYTQCPECQGTGRMAKAEGAGG